MSLALVYSRASVGIDAPLINVEVHLANGLPCFNLVGLPEASVREAKDRVRSALINSGFEFPAKRITLNDIDYRKNKSINMLLIYIIFNRVTNIKKD